MTYLHPVAAVPNNLITDTNLSYTTKRVAFVLLLLSGRKGRYVTVSFAALARLCKCSATTAQKAVKELCAQGYLLKSNRYHFGEKQNHLIYASNRYLWLRREGGYTLVSRDILAYDLTPASFVTLLYLYRCAGRKGRAFPSLRRIAEVGLAMSKSTPGSEGATAPASSGTAQVHNPTPLQFQQQLLPHQFCVQPESAAF